MDSLIEILAIAAVGTGMVFAFGVTLIVALVCANQKYKWAQFKISVTTKIK